jgi:transcriptional regulator with XRE-family HTH domain
MTPTELRALRDKLNLTQRELGEAIGKTHETICRYESGERPIPKTVAIAIAAYARLPKER